jgi:protease-4
MQLRLTVLLLLSILPGCMPSFLITPVSSNQSLKEVVVEESTSRGFLSSANKIVIIEVEGMLLNARTGGFLQAQENDVSLFAQQLKKAEKDPAVKAIVLRINSPGGTVSASDLMYDEVKRFKELTKKPVVASAQDIAASGAYYVACSADKIVVQPTSVVGSIGVIFNTFDISGSMEKIGAKTNVIKSGPLKDMGSPFKSMDDNERAVMQAMVDEYYARFKGIVQSNRKLDNTTLAAVTDGRVFTGLRAVELHLADQAGSLRDAIDVARELSHSPGAGVVLYKRPYGYSGSIYAHAQDEVPKSNMTEVNLLPPRTFLPLGFYYLWNP